MLCQTSNDIFQNGFRDGGQHHFSRSELQQAAHANCYICCILLCHLLDKPPGESDVANVAPGTEVTGDPTPNFDIWVIYLNDVGWRGVYFFIHRKKKKDSPYRFIFIHVVERP